MRFCQVDYATSKGCVVNFATTKALFNPRPRGIQNAPEPYPIRSRAALIRRQGTIRPTHWLSLRHSHRATTAFWGGTVSAAQYCEPNANPWGIKGETNGKLRIRYYTDFTISFTNPATYRNSLRIRLTRSRYSPFPTPME